MPDRRGGAADEADDPVLVICIRRGVGLLCAEAQAQAARSEGRPECRARTAPDRRGRTGSGGRSRTVERVCRMKPHLAPAFRAVDVHAQAEAVPVGARAVEVMRRVMRLAVDLDIRPVGAVAHFRKAPASQKLVWNGPVPLSPKLRSARRLGVGHSKDGRGQVDLEAGNDLEMVLQVLAHAGKVMLQRDAEGARWRARCPTA